MSRTSVGSMAACPTLFTPLQLHARELLRAGLGGWMSWMREHTLSIQKMVANHRCSVVVAGANLHYFEPMLFHDGETIDYFTSAILHKKGILVEGVTQFFNKTNLIASVNVFLRPVLIGDEQSSAAKSGHLPHEIQQFFLAEELASAAFSREAKLLTQALESEGQLIVDSHRHNFKLYRYAMDFADQWAFMEAYSYISSSREELVLRHIDSHPRLIEGLSRSIKSFLIDLKKPYFLFDEGCVCTNVYLFDEKLFFVHYLTSQSGVGDSVHAVVIEEIGDS